MNKQSVLVAGASGYLGGYIYRALLQRSYPTTVLVRNRKELSYRPDELCLLEAELTHAETIEGCCKGVNTVISSVGITRQKDGLTYMDVDFQANVNLLEEAKKAGVQKFVYISVLNGEKLRHLAIGAAKERFVDYLKASGMDYCIIRPNGFFSDMRDFLSMAERGKVYLFGDGELQLNPIHGEDLANFCLDKMDNHASEFEVGGPDVLSQNQIAQLALEAQEKPVKIVHLPDWIRRLTLWTVRHFSSPAKSGPVEFFLTCMTMEMIAPQVGKHHLAAFFREEVERRKLA